MELTPQNQPQEESGTPALSIRDAIEKMFPESTWDTPDATPQTPHDVFVNLFIAPVVQPQLPTVDVKETADEFHITANVMGIDPKNLWVNINNGILTIKGTMHQGNALSTFTQQLSIPQDTTKEDVECEIEDGKLLITILKN